MISVEDMRRKMKPFVQKVQKSCNFDKTSKIVIESTSYGTQYGIDLLKNGNRVAFFKPFKNELQLRSFFSGMQAICELKKYDR